MLVTEAIIRQLEKLTRYRTLSKLTTNWDNLIALGITPPTMNAVDNIRLQRLGISIPEPWRVIVSGYKRIG